MNGSFCNTCGLPLPSGATICNSCNTPVQQKQNTGTGSLSGRSLPSTPRVMPGQSLPPQSFKRQGAIPPIQTFGKMIREYDRVRQPGFFFRMKCPFCDCEFHPNDCAVYSTLRFDDNGQNKLLRPAPAFRLIARLLTTSLEGPEYTKDAACRQCPRCENFLPYRFEADRVFNIAMVGDSFSGKSHYLAALLDQLIDNKIQQEEKIRIRLTPVNELAKGKWREFRETLFEHHDSLPGTKPYTFSRPEEIAKNFTVRQPLIFHLEIDYAFNINAPIKSVMNLVFHDIAGEEIANEVTGQKCWPILQAQAIIYFVDPLSMPGILNKLPSNNPQVKQYMALMQHQRNQLKPQELLEWMRPIFIRYNRLNHDGKVSTPIAIMLSKSDLLDSIARVNGFEHARFLQNKVYNGTVDLEDLKIVDSHTRQFLRQFGELGLVQESDFRFTTAGYFATSATGCTPDDHGKFKEVKPRRCLDPFFWLLWKLTESNR